ncbi:MAG: MBL fold metallo-hydrolase [Chloroflexota bacterium]
MIDQILPNLFRIEVPLPDNPLKALNSYLMKGDGRFLMVDTGMNRAECKQAMFSGLKELGVDLSRTDFFITHLHADHSGMVADLATPTSTIYFNVPEAAMRRDRERRWQEFYGFYLSHGFPEDQLKISMENHPGRKYGLRDDVDFHVLKEGDALSIGDYCFSCIETPGHTPGHMCLYEGSKKVLLSGDHILFDITPNITYWLEMENPLKQYLESLEKVYPLDVSLTLPGHRNRLNNHRKRIRELQEHHRLRLGEAMKALEHGEKSAFEVAPYITWDVVYRTWEEFPIRQKWFAVGETMAHLRYLEKDGRIRAMEHDGRITYSLA